MKILRCLVFYDDNIGVNLLNPLAIKGTADIFSLSNHMSKKNYNTNHRLGGLKSYNPVINSEVVCC